MMRLCWAALIGLAVLGVTCDTRRGQVPSQPGETPEELEAAGEVLAAVGASVPLIEVRLSADGRREERRSVGAVVGEERHIIADAGTVTAKLDGGADTLIGHSRRIEAVFHPGRDDEQRYPATVLRESGETGLALLSIEGEDVPALTLGDDVPDETRVFLVSAPLGLSRPAAQAGEVRRYADTDEGRRLVHTAGQGEGTTGPLIDTDGEIVGVQVERDADARGAIPAVEIARWLQMPPESEAPPSEPGQVTERLLRQMAVTFRPAKSGGGYVLPRPDGMDVRVRQTEAVVSVLAELGTLHVGDAMKALRSNYSDPVGALALNPAETQIDEQLVWVSRLPAGEVDAAYLSYVVRMASAQTGRWQQLQAGLEPDYPYDLYPGGDSERQQQRLLSVIRGSSLAWEESGRGYKLQPESAVPVYVNVFRGMAYVYAYSGGLPARGEAEQDLVARDLLRRNWELRLGRLSLDKYLDLAWEAQVPMVHLSAPYLEALTRAGAAEIADLKREYGEVPFNEE